MFVGMSIMHAEDKLFNYEDFFLSYFENRWTSAVIFFVDWYDMAALATKLIPISLKTNLFPGYKM